MVNLHRLTVCALVACAATMTTSLAQADLRFTEGQGGGINASAVGTGSDRTDRDIQFGNPRANGARLLPAMRGQIPLCRAIA